MVITAIATAPTGPGVPPLFRRAGPNFVVREHVRQRRDEMLVEYGSAIGNNGARRMHPYIAVARQEISLSESIWIKITVRLDRVGVLLVACYNSVKEQLAVHRDGSDHDRNT